MSSRLSIKRVMFGIPKLDRAINGGIPKGSAVVVCGPPGSGKTILSLQFLINGATMFNEPGVYVALEEVRKDIIEQAAVFGWDIEKLEEENKLKVVELKRDEIPLFDDKLNELKKDLKPQRFVLDSITFYYTYALLHTYTKEYARAQQELLIQDGAEITHPLVARTTITELIRKLKSLGFTSLLTSEISGSQPYYTRDQLSEFIADGVVLMDYLEFGEDEFRSIKIVKMRKTGHEVKHIPFEITSKGIEIREL